MSRPLAWVAVALLAGTLAGAWELLRGVAFPISLVVVSCLLASLSISTPRIRPFAVALCFIGAGAALWNVRYQPPGDPLSAYIAKLPRNEITVSGTVRSTQIVMPEELTPEGKKYIPRESFIVDVERVTQSDVQLPIHGRAIVSWRNISGVVYPGERVSITGDGRQSLSTVNFGVRGYEDYLRNWGVHSAIDCPTRDSVSITSHGPWFSPSYWAARLRQSQANRLARVMPVAVLDFVYAVWLGQQSALEFEEYQLYVGSGTAHILSVSGVHAGIVFLTLNFVLRMFQLQRRTRALIAMAGVFSFALIAGASVPAMRAAIMVSLYLLADVLEREPDTTTALSIAGIIFLLWDPRCVFDTGFLLSFLCIASILLFQPLFTRGFERVPRLIRPSLATSFSVQLVPLPVVASSFHTLTLVAPLTNLFAIWLLAVVLWLCFVTSLLSYVWIPAAQIAGYATLAPIETIRWVAKGGSWLNGYAPALTTPTPLAIMLYWTGTACLAACMVVKTRRRRALQWCSGALFVIALVVWNVRPHEPEIVQLDVGNADSAFIRTPQGDTMLIDGGDRNQYGDAGQQVVAPFLWARGISRLDAVMASHADSDHIGGLIYIVDNFRVNTAYLPAIPSGRPLEELLLRRCTARGTKVVRVKRGDVLSVGGTTVSVLNPDPESHLSVNNNSIVASVPFGPVTALFAGDIEDKAEDQLVGTLPHADILKVPHHGSNTSSTPEFISAVSPTFAVISASSHGRQVMDPEIVRRYEAQDLVLLRTDRLGAVRFTLDSRALRVESARAQRGYSVGEE